MGAIAIAEAVKLIDNTGAAFGVRHAANKPRVSATSYLFDVVLGNIPGHSMVTINGKNNDIDNVLEDLWETGGTYVFPPAGGIGMQIQSTSANDTAAGTGARTVDIDVLFADYSSGTITRTLNGVTPVTTTETNILRVNDIHVMTAGSIGAPDGTITLTNVGATVTYGQITAGLNVMKQSVYTVPLGKTLYIVAWKYGAGPSGTYANFMLRAQTSNTGEAISVFHTREEGIVVGGSDYIMFPAPIKVLATADVKISAVSSGASSNAICHAGFVGWLE